MITFLWRKSHFKLRGIVKNALLHFIVLHTDIHDAANRMFLSVFTGLHILHSEHMYLDATQFT